MEQNKIDYSGTLRKVTVVLDGEENILYFIDPIPLVMVQNFYFHYSVNLAVIRECLTYRKNLHQMGNNYPNFHFIIQTGSGNRAT